MPGSLIISGSASFSKTTPSALLAAAPLAQVVTPTVGISCQGASSGGDAPYWQSVAISATSSVILPTNAIVSGSPFRDGQRLTIINSGAHSITFPTGALNPGSQAETIEPKQCLELFFRAPIGWLPMDDDNGVSMPLMLANQNDIANPSAQRAFFSDKGLRLRNGTIPEPVARLQTTSLAARGRRVGSGTNISYEDFTVILDDGQPGTFILPDPKTCPDRILNLVAMRSVINLSIMGGSKAKKGTADYLLIPAGGVALLQSIGDSSNAHWYWVGGL